MRKVPKLETDDSQTIVPPAYTGVALLLSWTYLLFYARSAGIEAAAPVSLMSAGYTISAFSMVAVLFAIAFLPRGRIGLLTAIPTKILTPLFMSVGSTFLVFGEWNSITACVYIGGVVTGVSSGFMSQQWIAAYRKVGLHTAISSFPTLMTLAVCLCMTLMYMPSAIMFLAIIVLPPASELMFHLVRREAWPEFEIERGRRNQPANFLLLLGPIFVYAVSSGFFDYFSGEGYYTFVFYALVALIPLVAAGIYVFTTERANFLQFFLTPLGVLTVALVPFLSLGSIAPMAHFVSIGELGIEVVVFIVVVGFADFFSLDPLKVSALSRGVIVVFNTCGWYAGGYCAINMPSLFNSQALLLVLFIAVEVFAIVLTVAIVKARKSSVSKSAGAVEEAVEPSRAATAEEPAPKNPEESGHELTLDEFEAHCRGVAQERGLSKREADVFFLLAKGYSSARIQGELYIAPGTVNYHTRNIYAKLGVHSKQEVIDLVEHGE